MTKDRLPTFKGFIGESKLKTKVKEMEDEGYSIVKYDEVMMNGKYYKGCIMEKDGKKIRVNHQGGIGGLSSAI